MKRAWGGCEEDAKRNGKEAKKDGKEEKRDWEGQVMGMGRGMHMGQQMVTGLGIKHKINPATPIWY